MVWIDAETDIEMTFAEPQQSLASTCGDYELEMYIDDPESEEYFELEGTSVYHAPWDMASGTLVTMLITVRSEYWEEDLVTATFEYLECEEYFHRAGAELAMSVHAHATDLTLDLASDASKTIAWDPFSYDQIPCTVSQYSVTCTGPDAKQYRIDSDGTVDEFGQTGSQCGYFRYEEAFTLHAITVDASDIDGSFHGDYQFEIQGFSDAHPQTVELSLTFTV